MSIGSRGRDDAAGAGRWGLGTLAAMLLVAAPLGAQTVVVRGTVSVANGGPALEGARVVAVGTSAGAQTDAQGHYALTLAARRGDSVTLRAARIGYQPAMRTVAATRDTLVVDFALAAAAMQLQELVVTATGVTPQRATLGSAVASPYGARAGNGAAVMARGMAGVADVDRQRRPDNTEEYARIEDNAFLAARSHPLSTFSIDVDRASYSNVRRFVLVEHRLPPKDAVRIEELVNYFPYAYVPPTDGRPVAAAADVSVAPWNPAHRLVRVALQAQRIPRAVLPPSNLVFLIDVSGSMMPANKLPLLKQSLRLLVNELRPQDRVAMVVYAGSAGLVLPSTPASEKERILDALDRLEAGGSTAGGQGLLLAYQVAKEHFIPGGNNRVILATDGDFNVGVSSTSELVRLVEAKRQEGSFLTVLGFGMGNLKDDRLEQLADKGNGNYAYIDDEMEARKVLVQELGGTLVTVARDVKVQVEFNPARVQGYRLIGYENRLLAAEDFADDRKDAGEMGEGHAVTALYEVLPVGAPRDVELRDAPALRYQSEPRPRGGRSRHGDELLQVSVRYKRADAHRSELLRLPVGDATARPTGELAFASAVAGYGMLLRESPFRGNLTYDAVLELARSAVGADPDGYRAGFLRLVEETSRLHRDVARRE